MGPLQVLEVSFSDTVLTPGRSVTISAIADSLDVAGVRQEIDVDYAWTFDAGEPLEASGSEVVWTAPDADQLVRVTLVVTGTVDAEAGT